MPYAHPITLRQDAERLLCPTCGSDLTHIERIEIGARPEDQGGLLISVDAVSGETTVTRIKEVDGHTLPSSRRQWVTLHIECEACEGTLDNATPVILAQHKGNTYVHRADASEVGGGLLNRHAVTERGPGSVPHGER